MEYSARLNGIVASSLGNATKMIETGPQSTLLKDARSTPGS